MARNPFEGKKKSILTAVFIVFVVVAAAGAGVWLRMAQNKNDSQSQGGGQLVDKRSEETKRAQELALSGKTDEASKYVNDELAKQGLSADKKYDLYLQQGVIAYGQGKHEEALASYKQAEAAKKTREIYELLTDVAIDLGRKGDAVGYLKEAIKLLDSKSPLYEDTKTSMEEKIRSLGGSL